MSVRFPDEGLRKTPGSTPDSTLSCSLCQAQMQDARVIPGCLHSFCKNCLEIHAKGLHSFPCPNPSCNQVISQTIESLPANSYINTLATLDSESEVERTSMGRLGGIHSSVTSSQSSLTDSNGTSRMGAAGGRQTSPPLSLYTQLHTESAWRPKAVELRAQLPVSLAALSLGDNWNPLDSWPRNGNPLGVPALHKCGACDETHVVTAHCRECKESLCDTCVTAHQRVKLTKNHVILYYPGIATNPRNNSRLASAFPPSMVTDPDVLRVYQETVDKASMDNMRLCREAREGLAECENALIKIEARAREIKNKRDIVEGDVSRMVEQAIQKLREGEAILKERIMRIHLVKCKSLDEQQQKIRISMLPLGKIVDSLENSNLSDKETIEHNKKFSQTLDRTFQELGSMEPYEDDVITFVQPESIHSAIPMMGFVSSSGFYKTTKAEGDGLRKGVLGRTCEFKISVNDHLGEPCLSSRDQLSLMILSPDRRKASNKMDDPVEGKYKVRWNPHVDGEHYIYIQLNSVSIPGTPFVCTVRTSRDYAHIGTPIRVFGKEGSNDGEMCRPWGVCCTKDGFIVVADRSNNRIQVFRSDGIFHFKFGVEGKGIGQFNKPASVCIDSRNRLIVSDKDNHRIQIFTLDGTFLMKFGEKGSENGQFNYPWDVACNSKDNILVSDTRNHRLQLFSSSGEVLKKYGFEGQLWKHFDSPRGVCFAADDQAIVTDFNNHRLLVIGRNFENAQYLGSNGSKDGEFQRPNGVAVDDEGNIIVADSRNNRIQIFSALGVFIKEFGVKGTGPGELDTPQGICMTPDGYIVVVDSQHRIQIF